MKILIFYIIFFHIIVNINCQQYVPKERSLHTATLVGTKIYFLGGAENPESTKFLNDFFYLDVSKSFDKEKALPFIDLTNKASEIPPHYGAATTVFGALKDSIFFFGGDIGKSNDQSRLTYLFNATQEKWEMVTVSQSIVSRKMVMDAITDNNDKIYIFGGGIVGVDSINSYYSNEMMNFGIIDKTWTITKTELVGRDGHTATFLPDTGEIIYIGGMTHNGQSYVLIDINNVCI
jgi:N-acetylneuraminic acid mutarotase